MRSQEQPIFPRNSDAPEVAALPPPAHEDPAIANVIQEKGSLMDSEHAQHFTQHCCLCNRWISDPTALKRRLKHSHVGQWEAVEPKLEDRCATYAST